jgi:hypothetical protein
MGTGVNDKPNGDELLLANATNSAVLRLDCFHLTSFRVD